MAATLLAIFLFSATGSPLLAQEGITVVYVVQPGETLSSIAAQYSAPA